MKKTLKKGFTLVELVIVIAVIAILSAVLIPTFGNVISNANKSAAQSEASNAVSQYITNAASQGINADLGDGYVVILDKKYTLIDSSGDTHVSDDWKDANVKYVFKYVGGRIEELDKEEKDYKISNLTTAAAAATPKTFNLVYNTDPTKVGTKVEGSVATVNLTESKLSSYGVFLLDYEINGTTVKAKVVLLLNYAEPTNS